MNVMLQWKSLDRCTETLSAGKILVISLCDVLVTLEL